MAVAPRPAHPPRPGPGHAAGAPCLAGGSGRRRDRLRRLSRAGALRRRHDLRQLERRLDHHQEPGVSRMVAAGAAAGHLRAAGDRVRVPLPPPARRARAPPRGDLGGVMGWIEASLVLFGGLVAVMGLGVPVAFAFLAVNVVGAAFFLGGEPGLAQLARNAVQSITSFALTPIPFFVLMGEVLFHSGVALKAIDAIAALIRRVPGRLAVIAIVAGTVFSAISGSTIATTALLGSLMLPAMLERGYHPRMAMGPIMGIGGVAGISIAGLLIGGIVPGLILSATFVGYIVVRTLINPALAPAETLEAASDRLARWRAFVVHVLPLMAIFALIVVAMAGGWATPTEAAALGAAATIAAAACYRRLSLAGLMKALHGTVAVSGT